MAELNYPNSPAIGDVYARWRWDGTGWTLNQVAGDDIGLPGGGTTGQLLAKNSDIDGDAEWVDGGSYSMSAPTVDTGDDYRVVLFSDGTVRAIPIDAVPPEIPFGLDAVERINSVRLSWIAAPGASSYAIWKDGAQIATTTSTAYRDRAVTIGETYVYTVQSISQYALRSSLAPTVSSFIDPALNVAPSVDSITVWPTGAIPVGHRATIRVNAVDVDAQTIALTLGVDVGTLVASPITSIWYMEP